MDYGGGRAGVHEYRWVQEGYHLAMVELQVTTFQAAAIDPTRFISLGVEITEAARHMLVDGVPMEKHHHYQNWRRRANEMLPLSKAIRRKLKWYRPQIRVSDLIAFVKSKPIN